MKKRLMVAGLVVLMAATAFTGCSKVKKSTIQRRRQQLRLRQWHVLMLT